MKGRDKRRRAKATSRKAAKSAEKRLSREGAKLLIDDCRIPSVVALLSPGACRTLQEQGHAECEGCKRRT
jgi:hypothetical protein